MRKVITYGTYDLLHQGHINLLRRAKELGDYLIVGITSDYFNKCRGKFNVHDDLMTRIKNVEKCGFADEIVVEEYQKVLKVLNEVPVTKTLLHCDFHLKNQLMGHGELMLIDMDTLCIGDPIFELASIYNSYYGFGIIDKKAIEDFLGISIEKAHYLWDKISRKYYDDLNDEEYQKMCRKIESIGLLRVQHFFDKHQYNDVIEKGAVLLKESIARLED